MEDAQSASERLRKPNDTSIQWDMVFDFRLGLSSIQYSTSLAFHTNPGKLIDIGSLSDSPTSLVFHKNPGNGIDIGSLSDSPLRCRSSSCTLARCLHFWTSC